MTEETKQKLPKIIWKDKEYEQENLTNQQKYLFNHILDIQKKENEYRFGLDQIHAMKEIFEKRLEEELQK